MRDGVYEVVDGKKVVSLYKLTGKGYERGWFTNCNCRYRLFEGARSTKKSVDILGYEPIFKILSDKRRNVMICRKNDSDNRQSTFENICGRLADLDLLGTEFKATLNPLEITYLRTGQKIIFRGLNNPTSLNSVTFAHGYLTDIYIEEAFELDSYQDFRKLDGSLRGKYPGITLQITMCFNAWDGDSWLNEEFFKGRLDDDFELLEHPEITYLDYKDEDWVGPFGKGLYLHKSTYKINEFRDKELYDAAAMECKEKDPERYKVEFLGMFGVTTGKVYRNWKPEELIIPIQKIIATDRLGNPVMDFADFAIGLDTGLSDGEGKIKTVKKNENQDVKIKAATTMSLGAITTDYKTLVTIDEYFHSNNRNDNSWNTDNRDVLTEPEQVDACARQIVAWIREFSASPTCLMKGQINIYVDCADIGFRQSLEVKLREYDVYNAYLYGSSKRPIRMRVSFTNMLMAYGEFLVCDRCKNLIREIKNCRKGEGNKARADGNDHMINSHEYFSLPFYQKLIRWADYKEH